MKRPRDLRPVLAGGLIALAGAGLIVWLQLMIYIPAVEQGRMVAIGIPLLLLIDAFGIGLFAVGLAVVLGALRRTKRPEAENRPGPIPFDKALRQPRS